MWPSSSGKVTPRELQLAFMGLHAILAKRFYKLRGWCWLDVGSVRHRLLLLRECEESLSVRLVKDSKCQLTFSEH